LAVRGRLDKESIVTEVNQADIKALLAEGADLMDEYRNLAITWGLACFALSRLAREDKPAEQTFAESVSLYANDVTPEEVAALEQVQDRFPGGPR
jgi:hypothetical protein